MIKAPYINMMCLSKPTPPNNTATITPQLYTTKILLDGFSFDRPKLIFC